MSSCIGFSPEDRKPKPLDRYVSTVAICAAIIVAVRVSRLSERDLTMKNVNSTVEGAVRLAVTILDAVLGL
jgi:hypothetical protein